MFVVRPLRLESSSVGAACFEHQGVHAAPMELIVLTIVVSTNMALLRSYWVAISDEVVDAAEVS
jgi:hypothetical protein